ncbi:hypothetical protein CGRA01v4_08173 [Colletotrichum graminicola]|nr:hypothetical protein CGRA01v4_08173 [Colletotrichum graminicola]
MSLHILGCGHYASVMMKQDLGVPRIQMITGCGKHHRIVDDKFRPLTTEPRHD